MSNIRVTYSGLISLVIGLISIITGLVFTLVVAREFTQNELGTWALLGSLIGYASFLQPTIAYWTTREIARGHKTGKTAFYTSGMISGVGILIFLIVAYAIGSVTTEDSTILFFAVLLIPVQFIWNILMAISLGHKPQIGDYGFLIQELIKIPFVFLFVYFFQMGIQGVILAVVASLCVSNVFLIVKNREKITGVFDKSIIKWWLRHSWIPSYPRLSKIVFETDIIIFTIITGSAFGLSYWIVSKSVAAIVGHSNRINKALYPKLLQGGRKEFFQESMVKFFYFAFPLCAISIIFSQAGLFALNPIYVSASPIVITLVFAGFIASFTKLLNNSLKGIETVDTNRNASTRDYLRSKLFYLPTLGLIKRSIYIVLLVIMLLILISKDASEISLVFWWSVLYLLMEIPFAAYFYTITHKEFKPDFNKNSIIKYLFATIFVFGLFYFLTESFLVYEKSIFIFLPNLIMFVIPSFLAYLGITYLIDLKTRNLFQSVINEILKIK